MKALDQLWERGCQLLGTRYSIMAGAMTWVSERYLVSAISEKGGFGVLACGAMAPERLKEEINATRLLTTKPFGVNLITLHPQLPELVQVCIDEHVSHVVLAGGLPQGHTIETLKQNNIKVLAFAPALIIGKKLVRQGVDGLIIEGNEAGGHIGPVSTSVLAQEILPHIQEVPVFVAGGIGHGSMIRSYLELGASGVQLGTRFVCAHECQAHPNFKKAFIKAGARHATASYSLDSRLPVIPVRAIENEGTKAFHQFQKDMIQKLEKGDISSQEAQMAVEHYWSGALRRAVIDGDIVHGSLMAGQSVGMVSQEQSIGDIFDELIQQAASRN
jgi:enoyl-[acyl-carrier protein] reductase II